MQNPPKPTTSPKGKKLLDQYRDHIRLKQYSPRTEKTYIQWVREYILYHNKRHPKEMGAPEIKQFITHLVVDRKASASTQNQVISAIPVLSKDEAKTIIQNLTPPYKLMVQIMYGAGLRLMECLRLRIKDIDFENHRILVYDGKGGDDRQTPLPDSIIPALREHLAKTRAIHQKDLAHGRGSVHMPFALAKKFPNAHTSWIWQYVFPATTFITDKEDGIMRRHHIHKPP